MPAAASYRPKMVCFLSRYAQERKVIKLGEGDRVSGRARQLPHPACWAPKTSGHTLGISVPSKQLRGAAADMCAAPTLRLVRAGRQPRPPRGTGTPAPQEKPPGTAAQERPRKALPPAPAAANFCQADRRCQSPQAEAVGGAVGGEGDWTPEPVPVRQQLKQQGL